MLRSGEEAWYFQDRAVTASAMGDVLIPQHHQQPCWRRCQGTAGHQGLGTTRWVSRGEPCVSALSHLTRRASAALQGIPKPPPASSSNGPGVKGSLYRRRGKAQKDKPCPPARAQQEGGTERVNCCPHLRHPPKPRCLCCSSGNGITVAMAFCQHQHCQRLNNNTQCYFKG